MKKLLSLCFTLIISSLSLYAADMKFVQIDNLRYSSNSKSSVDDFDNVIKEINKQKNISFVVFTGNNIAKSDEENLKSFLKTAKKLHPKFYVALGHKDVSRNKGLSKNEYMKIVRRNSHRFIKSPNYTFKQNGIVFIVADGSKEIVPTSFGYYRPEVIGWIDEQLTKSADKKAIILQHFPINPPSKNEAYNTYRADEYFRMLERHNNVIAIVSGFGINSEEDIRGIKHITTASYPSYRIIEIIDLQKDEPTIWSTLK